MSTLGSELRNKLERTIIQARDIAEEGSRIALESLAVHHYQPYDHMTPEQRRLRNHLRAHARQLGDKQDAKGALQIGNLIHECAYEHWHRMLFARFLADNGLLIEPDSGVAITLEECEELSREGDSDMWTLASLLAQNMLPQIFRPEDPVLQLWLPKEFQLKLERLLDGLDRGIFLASDAIGWVYQFWQTKRKNEVNESGDKIGARELPAVTQLFTEDYMVDFTLDNTLGAWWVSRHPDKTSVFDFQYLRRKEDGTPVAGGFEGWPDRAAELKCLDPCCGSGHFLVALFDRLVPMRMVEESLSQNEAGRAVLRDNLYGLEIDARCTQIAAFSLALAAWKLDQSSVHDPLPSLNIACCGLEIGASRDEWKALAPEHGFLMNQFYGLFKHASTLGSLIDPREQVRTVAGGASIDDLRQTVLEGLEREHVNGSIYVAELGVTAKGVTDSYRVLTAFYHLVATNVPYLARSKQNEILREFIQDHYFAERLDLATACIARCLEFCEDGGTAVLVTPQNWFSLPLYRQFRGKILCTRSFDFIIKLGPRAFETIGGEVVNVALIGLSKIGPGEDTEFFGLDSTDAKDVPTKISQLRQKRLLLISQKSMLQNPDSRITLEEANTKSLLKQYAFSPQGVKTGDDPRFRRYWWELPAFNERWRPFQGAPLNSGKIEGMRFAIDWKDEGRSFARLQGIKAWGKRGILVRLMGDIAVCLYDGDIFDSNVTAVIPKNPDHIKILWRFLNSDDFFSQLKRIEDGIKVNNATVVKTRFDLKEWSQKEQVDSELCLPKLISDDPIQWIFHGRPEAGKAPLHTALARMLGHRWPSELDKSIRISAEAQALVDTCEELMTLADEDGIVCIPSVRGEDSAADRFRALLVCAFGADWKPHKAKELIEDTGSNVHDLDAWLRDDGFGQHCKLFQHRPFIWHIWDGRRDGFHALVNYHKLAEAKGKGRKLLENLTYSYLGEWINRQNDGVKRGTGGAEDRLAAALELQKRLVAILEGEPPFDLFVRWKPLHKQPIGWEPDINDGVRVNIRPFLARDLTSGRKGAGILRWRPNINWNKDRGKEPICLQEEYPWFWEDGVFTGNRYNDKHYTNAQKREAREKAKTR